MPDYNDNLGYFLKELNDYENYSFNRARVWRAVYYVSRAALIIFAVLTSADALAALPSLAMVRPVFGILVALITAFDVWLKPETKFKGYYLANDEYDELEKKVRLTVGPTDKAGLRAAIAEYREINKRLRAAL